MTWIILPTVLLVLGVVGMFYYVRNVMQGWHEHGEVITLIVLILSGAAFIVGTLLLISGYANRFMF